MPTSTIASDSRNRMLLLLLYGMAIAFLAYEVGGLGTMSILVSALCIWIFLDRLAVFAASTRLLAALIFALSFFLLTISTVLPIVEKVGFLSDRLITKSKIPPNDFLGSNNGFEQSIHPWAIVLAYGVSTALVLGISGYVYVRRVNAASPLTKCAREDVDRRLLSLTITHFAVLIPIFGLYFLQKMDSVKALAFTMSGDARNNFLTVMRMRVNDATPSLKDLLLTGRFGETIATGLSRVNGTTGLVNIEDQYAIRSAYLIFFVLILCSLSTLVVKTTQHLNGKTIWYRNAVIVVVSTVALCSPYPLHEIFRSGFFSLFAGMSLGIAAIVFVSSIHESPILGTLTATSALILVHMSYPLLTPAVASVLLVVVVRLSWQRGKWQQRLGVVGLALCVLAASAVLFMRNYERIETRLNDGGAIEPTSLLVGGVCLAFGSILLLVSRRETRLTIGVLLLAGYALLGVVVGIRIIRNIDAFGYYGFKMMYVFNTVSFLVLVPALFGLVDHSHWSKSLSTGKAVATKALSAAASLILLAMFALAPFILTQERSLIVAISKGWSTPNESVVEMTIKQWKQGNWSYLVTNYASDSNDRLGNFWSPYFWERNRWEWTYLGYDVTPGGVCSISDGRPIELITNSLEYLGKLRTVCPDKADQFTVVSDND